MSKERREILIKALGLSLEPDDFDGFVSRTIESHVGGFTFSVYFMYKGLINVNPCITITSIQHDGEFLSLDGVFKP